MEKTTKRPRNNYGLMQREALKHIKGNDLRVYMDLLTYADKYGKCYPGVERIANDIDITPRNVQKHLANLESAGWIEKNLRTNTSTMYQLYFVDTSGTPTKTTKMKSSGASKSDVSPLSKSDRSGASISDVSGVSKSDVLTDHVTDQNNRQQEQVVAVVVDHQKPEFTNERKIQFEKLWKVHKKDGESKKSALSAWKKYCEMGDKLLMNRLISNLDFADGRYMASSMKLTYEEYLADKKNKERIARKKADGTFISL